MAHDARRPVVAHPVANGYALAVRRAPETHGPPAGAIFLSLGEGRAPTNTVGPMHARQLAEVRRLPLAQAHMSDTELVQVLLAKQPSAPGLLWDRYATLVRGLLRRSIGPDGEIDDLVQDVFIRFFRGVGRLRDPAGLRSFLIGIAIRVAAGELRRRRLRSWLRLTASGTLPEPEREARDDDGREAVSRLYAILDELGHDARLAFVLRHIEGLELEDVAAGLGVSLATAKRRLVKAQAVVMSRVRRDPALSAYCHAVPSRGAEEDGDDEG